MTGVVTDRVAGQGSIEAADAQGRAALGLLGNSSIELSTNGHDAILRAAEILPPGMPVYVAKMPTQTLTEKLIQIRALRASGLDPVPHIAARQLASRLELRTFLEEAVSGGEVHRVLLIGGNDTRVAGPFRDSASVLASGLLEDAGIREIDVAGYPEGHPRIPADVLFADLETKMKLADDRGLNLNIVTQFSFAPRTVIAYCSDLALRAPGVPVYAGLMGPTHPARLLRFARICGVSTTLQAVCSLGLNALKLATLSSPDKHFAVMARHQAARENGNLSGIHLFNFGGFHESAKWISDQLQRGTANA
ncbi:MAG: methylenetetrahydrofolate reductase [Proteobacteria bacterium]|nr:methylenetetrahydrofolate reductase [Pseudomonadota bacterium]